MLSWEQISLASIWFLYCKFWILCNYFSTGLKIDPYHVARDFDAEHHFSYAVSEPMNFH